MHPELVTAIKENLTHGRSLEDVHTDVLNAGYTEAEWADAYQLATEVVSAPATPLSSPHVTTDEVANKSEVVAEQPKAAARSIGMYVAAVFFLCIVILGGSLFVVQPAWLSSGLNLNFLSGAPRDAITPEQLVPTIFLSLVNTKSAQLQADFSAELVPREPNAVVLEIPAYDTLSDDEIAATAAFLPKTLKTNLSVTGTYDISEVIRPDSTARAALEVVVVDAAGTPYGVSIGVDGQVVAGSGVFGRINTFDLDLGIFSAFFSYPEISTVLGEWIQLLTAEELAVAESMPSFQREFVLQIIGRAGEIVAEEVALTNFLVVTGVTTDTIADQRVYVYTYELQYDVLPALLRQINTRFNQEFGEEFVPATNRDLEFYIASLDIETLKQVQKGVTNTVSVTPEGQLVQLATLGRFVPDDRMFTDTQINTRFVLLWSNHNEPIVVATPDSYLTKSEAEDRLGITSSRERAETASTQMTLMNARSQAELYYSKNDFSYVGFCADANTMQLLGQISVDHTCVAVATTYRISVPLNDSWYCVDGSGHAAFIAVEPALTDTACVPVTSRNPLTESSESMFSKIQTGLQSLMSPLSQLSSVGQVWTTAPTSRDVN